MASQVDFLTREKCTDQKTSISGLFAGIFFMIKTELPGVYASIPMFFLACHSPAEHNSGLYLSFWTHKGDSQNLFPESTK